MGREGGEPEDKDCVEWKVDRGTHPRQCFGALLESSEQKERPLTSIVTTKCELAKQDGGHCPVEHSKVSLEEHAAFPERTDNSPSGCRISYDGRWEEGGRGGGGGEPVDGDPIVPTIFHASKF
jgi:hypothetical protein